jgi:hypothetical protein
MKISPPSAPGLSFRKTTAEMSRLGRAVLKVTLLVALVLGVPSTLGILR